MRCRGKTTQETCSGECELSVGVTRRLCLSFVVFVCLHDSAAKVADVLGLDRTLLGLCLCHDGASRLGNHRNAFVSHFVV